jgi:hypothetical protein
MKMILPAKDFIDMCTRVATRTDAVVDELYAMLLSS